MWKEQMVIALLLLVASPALAVEYASGRDIEDGATLRLARQWTPILRDGFEEFPGAWKLENFEDRLRIGVLPPTLPEAAVPGEPAPKLEPHSGKACLVIAGTDEKGDTAWGLERRIDAVPGGRPFRLSFQACYNRDLRRIHGHKELYWSRIRWLDAAGNEAGVNSFTFGETAERWREHVVQGTIPKNARQAVLSIGFDSPNLPTGSYVCLDDLSLSILTDPPRYVESGELISRPVRIPPGARLSYQAETPRDTRVLLRVRTAPDDAGAPGRWTGWMGPDGSEKTAFPAAGAPLPAASRAHAWAQYRVHLLTSNPAATPVVRSVTLGAGTRKVTERAWSGPDRRPPVLVRRSPGRTAQADAPVRFVLHDGEGSGIDPRSVRVFVDGRLVTRGLTREPDGTYRYTPEQPFTPVGIQPGFGGWAKANYQGLLSISEGEPREPGGAPSLLLRGRTGDTAFALTSPVVAVQGGATYHVRFWSRHTMPLDKAGEGSGSYSSGIFFLDAQGRPVGERVPIDFGDADPQWHETQMSVVAPPEARAAYIRIGWDHPNIGPGEEVAFADLSFEGPPAQAPWIPNLHQITVDASDLCGNALSDEMWLLIREPRTRGIVTLRDDGVTLIDGQPFFPIGIYAVWKREHNQQSFDRAFQELKEAGFNTAHTYNSARTPEFREFLDAATRHGFKLFISARGGANTRDPASVLLDVVADEAEPALLAWYLADDTASHIGPEELRRIHQAVRDIDPAHITVQADPVGSPENSRYADYVESTDGFLPELYPIRGDGPDQVPLIIRDMKTIAADLKRAGTTRKAIWAIVQVFEGWGWPRYPTDAEVRAMTYLSLIHGATGMTYYTYGGHGKNHGATHDPRVWANLKRVAGELAQLQNVLVERDPGVKVACEVVAGPARDALGYPSISTMVRRHSGFTYLFTASSSAENVKARFRVPGLGQKVECLFEERALSPQGGLLEDSFEPYGVHVYRWRNP